MTYTEDDMAEAFDAGVKSGFSDGFLSALDRVVNYANCITGPKGETCKWFAKNAAAFEPVIVNANKEGSEK